MYTGMCTGGGKVKNICAALVNENVNVFNTPTRVVQNRNACFEGIMKGFLKPLRKYPHL